MNKWVRLVALTILIAGHATLATAQQSVKILTPNSDSCAAFVEALNKPEPLLLIGLAGWATGYLSGVAQGTGIDFLRQVEPGNTSVFLRLEKECQQQPSELLSIVLERMSRKMIEEHGVR